MSRCFQSDSVGLYSAAHPTRLASTFVDRDSAVRELRVVQILVTAPSGPLVAPADARLPQHVKRPRKGKRSPG